MCILMFSKAQEIERLSIDQELRASDLNSPDANRKTIHVLHTTTRDCDCDLKKIQQ